MENTQIQLAEKYVRFTNTSVFLTGKAGTGKTTFLRNIVETCNKRFVVVAPTGVAAINAGGSTIHSFFQLPPSAFLPTVKDFYNEYSLSQNSHNLRRNKIKILQSLDLLIIDEISMVRADLLDAIDDRLRQYRHNSKPFGGVQLLMVGDLYQLPPVVKEDEWQYMKQVYASPFFFESKAFKQLNYISIELTHVYRQNEAEFVEILNNIRQQQNVADTLQRLNSRCQPNFQPNDKEKYIQLTTHNAQAAQINDTKLDQLKGRTYTFEATITGTFPEYMYPTDCLLKLKKGAQVMFVRNDPSSEKRYYNGKIVTVSDIGDLCIEVTENDGSTFYVEPIMWENTKYVLNEETKEIEAVVDGTFMQMPLRLAWAITIHKSQGLTFDRAIIDAGRAFAFGQTYVALSRCRTLGGLVLKSPLSAGSLFSDANIDNFTKNIPPENEVQERYTAAHTQYFFETLFELFDFSDLQKKIEQLHRLFSIELAASHSAKAQNFDQKVEQPFFSDIITVAEKFKRLLFALQAQCGGNTADPHLLDRIHKASEYFLEKTEAVNSQAANFLDISIKNKETAKRYSNFVEQYRNAMGMKIALMKQAKSGFSVEQYTRTRTNFILSDDETTKPTKNVAPHLSKKSSELYGILSDWRDEKTYVMSNRSHSILSHEAMLEMAQIMPRTKEQLMAIVDFGAQKFKELGHELLEIINMFCEAHEKNKKQKGETFEITLQMLNDGRTPEQIAETRGLALSTIQSHITRLIKQDKVKPDKYIATSDLNTILRYITENQDKSTNEIYEHFEGKYDYFHIRIAMAVMEKNVQTPTEDVAV